MVAYGSADQLHHIIDSDALKRSNGNVIRLNNNPEYNRSHVDKLLGSGDPSLIAMAFHVGSHITPEDMDRHIDNPEFKVKTAIIDRSWNPEHFTKVLRSNYCDYPSNIGWIANTARSRGILKREHLDIIAAKNANHNPMADDENEFKEQK